MDSKTRYERLFEAVSSPKSLDCGRGTIYQFPKYCKACGTGLKQINKWDRKTEKALFRKSYCSDTCVGIGPKSVSTFPASAKERHSPSKANERLMEEMAFAALEIQRQRQTEGGLNYLVRHAHLAFNLLSEKLSFLESVTGMVWKKSKFYWWLRK